MCFLKSPKVPKKLFHISSSYKKFFSSKEKPITDPIEFLKTHLTLTPRINYSSRNSYRNINKSRENRNLCTKKLPYFHTENSNNINNNILSPKLVLRKRFIRNLNNKIVKSFISKNKRKEQILSMNEIMKIFNAKNKV